MLRRFIGLLALALPLGGCFEINSDASFNEKGGALLNVEFGVSAELMAMMANPAITQGKAPMDMFAECGNPVEDAKLPPGVRSMTGKVGQRSGMFTCTVTIDVADPIAAFASAKEKAELLRDFSIERLSDADGYRIRATLTPPKKPEIAGTGDSNNMANALAVAMFANRFITINIAALRVENTNGEVLPDGQKVVWRVPLVEMFGPNASMPFTIEADVIYTESWLSRWKRRLFG